MKKVNYNEYVGKKFNRLTIIEILDERNKHGMKMCKVLCECGNTNISVFSAVKYGHAKSCGCLRADNIRKYSDPGIRRHFHRYKVNAKKREYDFNLTRDEFDNLALGNCHYCGTPPSMDVTQNGITSFVNGVDRVDNGNGYSLDNCVTCCSTCNKAKGVLSYNDFMNWIRRLKNYEI